MVKQLVCIVLEFFGVWYDDLRDGKSLKFEGGISDIQGVILVDSGAKHYFMSRQLVSSLGLTSIFCNNINIKTGDDHNIIINQCYDNPMVFVGPCDFIVDSLIFDTGQLDITGKMIGFKLLGIVIHYWDKLERQFE